MHDIGPLRDIIILKHRLDERKIIFSLLFFLGISIGTPRGYAVTPSLGK
jgi:hypothetical protein